LKNVILIVSFVVIATKMLNSKKIQLILFLLFLLFLVNFGFLQALEIQYPEIPGAEAPKALGDYINYIFRFLVITSGLVAFGVLIFGGVKYLLSAGSPVKISEARGRIFQGFLGLIIVISSYLILTTINPQLAFIEFKKEEPKVELEKFYLPGVYLCQEHKEKCQRYTEKEGDLRDLKVNYIYIKNVKAEEDRPGFDYLAVLHEDKDFKGGCDIVFGEEDRINIIGGFTKLGKGKASSIQVFKTVKESSGKGVTLYEELDYEKEIGNYQAEWPNIDKEGRSIKINEEEKWLAVLFEGTDYKNRCEVFTKSDPNLLNNYIANCWPGINIFAKIGCFGSIYVHPIK